MELLSNIEKKNDAIIKIEAFNNSKIQEKEATELKRQELENKLLDFEANQTNTTSNTEQEEDEEGDFSKTNVALSFLQKMTVEQIFAEFDTDGSGLIDLEEFKNMLPTLGIKLSEAKALKYFKVCDVDGSGQIDIDEFRTALFACDPVSGNTMGFNPSKLLTPADAFEMFDSDGSGQLGEDEFADVLEYLGMVVSDEKQEKLFKQFDKDDSGNIDFDEFKAIWLKLANIKQELINRGVPISTWSNPYTMMRKLELILEEEEEAERKALAESKRWAEWQAELRKKNELISKANERSIEELCNALDAAGQVYVFGIGTAGSFLGKPQKNSFEEYSIVKKHWESRVSPQGDLIEHWLKDPFNPPTILELSTQNQNGISSVSSGDSIGHLTSNNLSKRAIERGEGNKPSDPKFPFSGLICMSNTAALWGRRIVQVGLSEHSAFGLTSHGRIYAWGGRDVWWDAPLAPVDCSGEITARSKLVLNTEEHLAPETELKEEDIRRKEENIEAEKLKMVLQYYERWSIPPNNATRLLFMKETLLPNINYTELCDSLKLRGKNIENKNKLQLVDMIHEDLLFEQKNGLTSMNLRKLELEIKDYKDGKKEDLAQEVTDDFTEIWAELFKLQLIYKEEQENRKVLDIEEKERKIIENYETKRMHEKEMLVNKEKILTARGASQKIPLNGITYRGPLPNTFRANTALCQISGGSHHVAAVHQNGHLYVWGDGSYGRLGLASRFGETLPGEDFKWSEGEGGEVKKVPLAKNDKTEKREEDEESSRNKKNNNEKGNSSSRSWKSPAKSFFKGKEKIIPSANNNNNEEEEEGEEEKNNNNNNEENNNDNKEKEKSNNNNNSVDNDEDERKKYGAGFVGSVTITERRVKEVISMRADAPKPTRIKVMDDKPIHFVDCGFSHTACISNGGRVFIWGAAVSGKLGLGRIADKFECFVPTPTRLHMPGGRRVSQISCGNAHTACVSESGELLIWGCGDGGRLGLGFDEDKSLRDYHSPVVVNEVIKVFYKKKIQKVSCGGVHTLVLTEVVYEAQGDGANRFIKTTGGEVYQAGAYGVCGEFTPEFKKVKSLKNKAIKDLSAGYLHNGVVTVGGELYTWGNNIGGCAAQPVWLEKIPEPTLVRALYIEPSNLALGHLTAQSSVYNGLGPSTAVNGDRNGDGVQYVAHTQFDNQAWWEVDLGKVAVIEMIKVWNREDEPVDESRPRNEYTCRLFPCWILVSQVPLPTDTNGRNLEKALKHAVVKKKFTSNCRELSWSLPSNVVGRYVRVQLERSNYLNLAEVEVFGVWGIRKSVGKVSSVVCGREVTVAVIEPLQEVEDIENAYTCAVKADSGNSRILRHYEFYYDFWDKWRDGIEIKACPLCRGGNMCEICLLNNTWNFKLPVGTLGQRRRLASISKGLLDMPPPPLDYKERKYERKGVVNQIADNFNKFTSYFKPKPKPTKFEKILEGTEMGKKNNVEGEKESVNQISSVVEEEGGGQGDGDDGSESEEDSAEESGEGDAK